MTAEEEKKFRDDNGMELYGKGIPKPIRTFQEANFPKYILEEIKNAGFEKPTPIQCQGWPMALSGRDLIGIARTGSGKTLAFILPAIVHINAQSVARPGDGPICLVLSPTRELAVQTREECAKFGYSSNIKHVAVYGGASRSGQQYQIQKRCDIVIATPGRLLDFLKSGVITLKRVTYLVMDEADRMLDMGFEPQIRAILDQIRPDRQTLMWSATWPKEVRNLAKEFLSKPIMVSVGSLELTANSDVKQVVHVCDERNKETTFFKLWDENFKGGKTLIFTKTKRGADNLVRLIRDKFKVQALAIHGDKRQSERDWVLRQFKSGKQPVLVATDVAARGLDISDIQIVFNYDFPQDVTSYVHRIGRCGRAGKKGLSLTIFTEEDAGRARDLIELLQKNKQDVPKELWTFAQMGKKARGGYRAGGSGGYRRGGGGGGRYGGGSSYGGGGYGDFLFSIN